MQDDNGRVGRQDEVVKGENMKTQIIVYPEATGTHNGKAYKGITIAINGKTKGIARAYLPDTYNGYKGERVALAKMEIKRSRARVTELNHQNRHIIADLHVNFEWLDRISRKIEEEETKQAKYRQELKEDV